MVADTELKIHGPEYLLVNKPLQTTCHLPEFCLHVASASQQDQEHIWIQKAALSLCVADSFSCQGNVRVSALILTSDYMGRAAK